MHSADDKALLLLSRPDLPLSGKESYAPYFLETCCWSNLYQVPELLL